jgi:hypothetical protein
MPYRWEDDAYPYIDDGEWTEEELMIAAGRASYLRRLHRRHKPEHRENEEIPAPRGTVPGKSR